VVLTASDHSTGIEIHEFHLSSSIIQYKQYSREPDHDVELVDHGQPVPHGTFPTACLRDCQEVRRSRQRLQTWRWPRHQIIPRLKRRFIPSGCCSDVRSSPDSTDRRKIGEVEDRYMMKKGVLRAGRAGRA